MKGKEGDHRADLVAWTRKRGGGVPAAMACGGEERGVWAADDSEGVYILYTYFVSF
jgi:hypothetical protein